ncbi:trimeric intracellular cation channel family protein [Orrella daihaiensis]|uniref:Trimeric intracellular cation channel family protein n=1 Tax=Orrella daihaiensis TaxID=2782176 RepID=A0ABY4ANX7_9BURK|nr:trimeric intracellular cation channel family protein [Orrella daihaiensis]UOD50737.1 trimeric intracellular cation channel family protein [Orrella daihaiensis]
MTVSYDTTTLLHTLYLIAIVAEAMTAALVAGQRQMDWLGVMLLGCVTALGGGSMRDVLLGNYPLTWVQNPHYLLLTGGAALFTIAVARYMHKLRNIFLLLDAIGLVVFTVIGCNIALALELPFLIVIGSGMITGCVGGVLRDLLCNSIPLLFRAELYATVSIVTGVLYVGSETFDINHDLGMAIAMTIGLTLRLLAIRFKWGMPKFIYSGNMD